MADIHILIVQTGMLSLSLCLCDLPGAILRVGMITLLPELLLHYHTQEDDSVLPCSWVLQYLLTKGQPSNPLAPEYKMFGFWFRFRLIYASAIWPWTSHFTFCIFSVSIYKWRDGGD